MLRKTQGRAGDCLNLHVFVQCKLGCVNTVSSRVERERESKKSLGEK